MLATLSFLVLQAAPQEVEKLVGRLGSDTPEIREKAMARLLEIGTPAIEALTKATTSADAEVNQRARRILAILDMRGLIPPSLLRLRPGIIDDAAVEGVGWLLTELGEDDLLLAESMERSELVGLLSSLLKREMASEEKGRVVDLIRFQGVRPLAPEVQALLYGPDGGLRERALWTLPVLIGSEDAGPIAKLLKHDDPSIRRYAAESLREMRAEASIPALIDALSDPKKEVRAAAANALASLRAREAIPHLLKLLDTTDEDVVSSVGYDLVDLYATDAIPHLKRLLASGGPAVSLAAASVLSQFGDPAGAPVLVNAIKSEAPEQWSSALRALRRLGELIAAPELTKLIEGSGAERRPDLVVALGEMGRQEAVPHLMRVLDRGDRWRVRAVETLVTLGARGAAPRIARILDDTTDGDLRYVVVRSLGTLQAREFAPRLLDLFEKEEGLRRAVADALVEMEAQGVADRLVSMLTSDHPGIRGWSRSILRQMKPKGLGPRLLKVLADGTEDDRWVAEDLLCEFAGIEVASSLIELLGSKEAESRRQAAAILGRIRTVEGRQGLLKALDDEDSGVRAAAAISLGALGATESIPALKALLAGEDKSARFAAAEVLGSLGARETIPDILPLIGTTDELGRQPAIDVLLKLSARDHWPAIAGKLASEDSEVVGGALDLLLKLDAREAAPQVARITGSTYGAIDVLARWSAIDQTEAIARQLSSADRIRRLSAIEALGTLRASAYADRVRPFLDDSRYRSAALVALGRMGANGVYGMLVELAGDRGDRRSVEARWVLNRYRAPKAFATIESKRIPQANGRSSVNDAVTRLSTAAGIEFRFSEACPSDIGDKEVSVWRLFSSGYLSDCAVQDEFESTPPPPIPSPLGEAIVGLAWQCGLAAVLEENRLVLMPVDDALTLWRAWKPHP